MLALENVTALLIEPGEAQERGQSRIAAYVLDGGSGDSGEGAGAEHRIPEGRLGTAEDVE
jgi:hypothetical protein